MTVLFVWWCCHIIRQINQRIHCNATKRKGHGIVQIANWFEQVKSHPKPETSKKIRRTCVLPYIRACGATPEPSRRRISGFAPPLASRGPPIRRILGFLIIQSIAAVPTGLSGYHLFFSGSDVIRTCSPTLLITVRTCVCFPRRFLVAPTTLWVVFQGL